MIVSGDPLFEWGRSIVLWLVCLPDRLSVVMLGWSDRLSSRW